MKYPWFYLQDTQPQNFLWNMALDEWMLHTSLEYPMVRLYRWDRPSYSIGYFQSVAQTAEAYACKQNQTQVVRRITGGGLVLHQQEWTLSVAMNTGFPLLPKTAYETYVCLHQILTDALSRAGYEARLMKAPCQMNTRGRRACFEEPVNHDVEVGGQKVVGSSQRRVAGRVLCQTSIQLPFNPKIAEEILKGFQRWFGLSGTAYSLSEETRQAVASLADNKYASEAYSFQLMG